MQAAHTGRAPAIQSNLTSYCTALYLQAVSATRLREALQFQSTSSQCSLSPLQDSHFLQQSLGEEEKRYHSKWLKVQKKDKMKESQGEDDNNSNVSSLPPPLVFFCFVFCFLFFSSEEDTVSASCALLLLHSAHYFREVNLTALHPPH